MKLTLHLTGTKSLLLHNGRLANPLDPHTRALKALTSKRKKTDDDLIELMGVESRGAVYETAEGLLGFPTQNVWRCLFDAAKAFKRGEDVKRAILVDDVVEPLLVDGELITIEDFLADPENIDYRPVRVQRQKLMRARPIIHRWSCTHHVELLDDVIDARDMAPILERAGRLVGLGDWRPTYGTFTVEVEA